MKSKLQPLVHQTKTQALRDQLFELVETLNSDDKLPTMRQLQESLHVSPMTLNRALSELEAQGLIYRRQGSGTYVSPAAKQLVAASNAQSVGLVYDRSLFGTSASPFGAILVEEAARRAERLNERFSLYLASRASEESPVHDDLREAALQGRLRGILYAGERNPKAVEWFEEQDIPVVSLSYHECGTPRVRINHTQLIRLGVKALAAKGCRRIGLWIPLGNGIGQDESGSFPELEAFQAALKKYGLEYSDELVWRVDEHTAQSQSGGRESNQEQGMRAARETFTKAARGKAKTQTPPIDGLIIDDDMMTRGALTAFSRLGITPGGDVQIATHANKGSAVLMGHENELTLLEVDPSEIARTMLDMLETLIAGGKLVVELVEIKPKLRA